MADPFGITAGAIGIAAAFTTCVDVFAYIHLGRRFGKDYQTSQLKLTLLRLRLSRWGEADTLLHILVLLDDSNKISDKFEITGDAGNTASDSSSDVDIVVCSVNNKMRDLATKRQKGVSLVKLASWAIHHGTAFKSLLNNISGLVDDLEDLFPAREKRKELAKEEVANLKDLQEVHALATASEGVDDVLCEEASKASGHQYKNIDIDGGIYATIANGNVFAKDWTGAPVSGPSHSYDGIKVKATEGLRMLNGNKYGGFDPFER